MIVELYEDIDKLRAIKEGLDNASTIDAISLPKKLILDMINQKHIEIGKIQDEHNKRCIEELLGRKL